VLQPDALYQNLRCDLQDYLGQGLDSLMGTGIYPSTLSVQEYAALALSNSFLKKYSGTVDVKADERALDKFLHSNSLCQEWTLQLDSSLDEILFGGFKSAVYEFFNPGGYQLEFDPFVCARNGATGPGSSLGSRGTDFYTKLFDSPLSCTDRSLYNVYSRSINSSPSWALAEKSRQSRYGDCVLCEGNRLSFVPKTTEISRVICTEPVLNMYFQFGAKHILESRLRSKFGIDLATQPSANRELARLGSDGWGFSTIDLESASDSISVEMLRLVLPREVFNSLSKYRSPKTIHPFTGDGIQLHMFSSMGNAFTFPLQTALFSCVVCSVYRYLCIPMEKPADGPGNFGVFGDDIACLDVASRYVIRLLNILGFRVNMSKSFTEGPFRESCGSDYYHGRYVRGVYLRGNEPHEVASCINQLIEFSAVTGVSCPRTCRFLRQIIKGLVLLVPRWESDTAGLKVPLSFIQPKVDKNGSYAYYAWEAIPKRLKVGDSESIEIPYGEKRRLFNSDGLYIAFLHGGLNAMTITVRQDRVRYRRKRRIAPNWQYASHMPCETTRRLLQPVRANWKRWETAFYMSL